MNDKPARMPRWQQIGAVAAIGVLLLLFFIWFYYCWDSILLVMIPFLLSLLLAYLLSPVVLFMEKRRISRPLAIIVIYLVFAIILFLIWVLAVPLFMDEMQDLAKELPGIFQQIHDSINRFEDNYKRFNLPPHVRELIDKNLDRIGEAATSHLDQLYQSVFDIIGGALLMLLVPVLIYYFLRDERYFKRSIMGLVPKNLKPRFLHMAEDINRSLGAFLRGSLLVSLAIGLLAYVSFLIIDLKFPLVLGVVIGLTNLVPLVGPIIGALPALLISLLQSPFQALKVLIIIVAIQQVEAQLIYPLIIGKSIGFHPVTIIFALLFAGKLFGFIGLIIALPAMITIRLIFQHLLHRH